MSEPSDGKENVNQNAISVVQVIKDAEISEVVELGQRQEVENVDSDTIDNVAAESNGTADVGDMKSDDLSTDNGGIKQTDVTAETSASTSEGVPSLFSPFDPDSGISVTMTIEEATIPDVPMDIEIQNGDTQIVNDKYLPDVSGETEAEAYFPKYKKVENQDNNSVPGCAIADQSSVSTADQSSVSIADQSSVSAESQSYSSEFSSIKDSSSNLKTESSEQSSHDATDNESLEDNLKVDLPPLEEVGGAAASEPSTSGPSDAKIEEDGSVYHIKWINFKSKEVPIITQNENGPCPLLAIVNVLLLKGRVKFAPSTEYITPDQVMTHLGDCILENAPKNINESLQLNYQQNMSDGMAVIHKLQTGLDVNVKFTGVQHFEYTPECILFDLLAISLYHGWLVDPQNEDIVTAVGKYSYNQLVEKIITQRSSDQQNLVTEALRAESFLDKTASQLTYHGLCELVSTVKEDELCVFFRNNHFSTMYKHQNELFLLVTDQGFLSERNVVWESLSNVEGDGHFVDSTFRTYRKPEPPAEPVPPANMEIGTDEQVDHDYLLAMSLQQEQQITDEEMAWKCANQQQQQAHLSDHELAAKLQAEEDQRALEAASRQQQNPQRQQQQQRSPPGGSTAHNAGGRRSRERERDRDRDRERDKSKDGCCIL